MTCELAGSTPNEQALFSFSLSRMNQVVAEKWLERKDWTEINDILRVQGFNRLSNGKDSCWMKMTLEGSDKNIQ